MERTPADLLLRELTETDDLAACLRRNEALFLRETVAQGLSALYQACTISKAELARRSDVSLVYLHQVFAGRRTPSRDRLLGLCFGLGATLDQTQYLLQLASCAPLCPMKRRDAVLIYAIQRSMTLPEARRILLESGEEPLY